MSAGIFVKDDPDVNKDQTSFEFEFIDSEGNITNTDVNFAEESSFTLSTAGWSSISVSANSIYSVGSSGTGVWSIVSDSSDSNSTHQRLDKIESVLRKIQDRLGVIEDVSDIEMKKALKKAYDKYRMVEDMIDKKAKE